MPPAPYALLAVNLPDIELIIPELYTTPPELVELLFSKLPDKLVIVPKL